MPFIVRITTLHIALWSAVTLAPAATHVVSNVPPAGGTHVLHPTNVLVRFNNPINLATVTSNSFWVAGQTRGPYRGDFSFASNNAQVTFRPSVPFARGELISVDVSDQIKDEAGDSVRSLYSQFTVFSAPSASEFAQALVYPAGQNPFALFAYDVNNDGRIDLVTANSSILSGNSKTVSVLLNDGTFTNRTDYVADPGDGSGPFSVCVVDLDGDGYGDIISANRHASEGAGTVSVLRNNGAGGFLPPVLYPAGERPVCVVAGDLNGDGHADIVACHGGQATGAGGLRVYLGDGTGALAAPLIVDTGLSHSRVGIADLDRDGDLDAFMSSAQVNSVSVLMNHGDGTFAPLTNYPVGDLPRAVASMDLNGDGFPDLVVANQTTENVTIYFNQGDGTFAGRIDRPVNGQPFGLAIADLDGNGFPDITTANYISGTVSYMLNFGGTFNPRKDIPALAGGPVDIMAADLDNDGDVDLVTANYPGNSVSAFINGPPTILGRVFLDLDQNCAQSGPGEVGVGGRFVRLTDALGGTRVTMTAPDGSYGFVAPAGSYTVSLITNATTAETCNNGMGITYNVTVVAGVPRSNINFGVAPHCSATVICASLISWPCPPNPPVPCTVTAATNTHGRHLCPCEPFQYSVMVCNSGTSPLLPGSVVRLQLDPNVLFCNYAAPPSSCNNVTTSIPTGGSPNPNPPCMPDCNPVAGQVLQWNVPHALNPGDWCNFLVDVQVANVPLGTVLCSFPSLIAHCNPGNMLFTVSGPPCKDGVYCSYDPNDMTVAPAGCGPFGNVTPTTPLDYRVRFQNLGNAMARRVIIRDQLDPALDVNTLELLSASHPVTDFSVLPGGELVWTFVGINLPHAEANELASRGEVNYRIRPKSSVAQGTTVRNSAAIYFDLNEPVITVTTTNTLRSVPEPGANFISTRVSMMAPWTFDLTYTGGTADGASFAWEFGGDATPAQATSQNVSGVAFTTDGPKPVTLIVSRHGCVSTNNMVLWAGPCEGTPTLSIHRSNNQIIVSWTECGVLQMADGINGPWQDVVARTPYTTDVTTRQRYYRTRN